jgi:hypothetical protein
MYTSACDPKRLYQEWHGAELQLRYNPGKRAEAIWRLRSPHKNQSSTKRGNSLLPLDANILVAFPAEWATEECDAIEREFESLVKRWKEDNEFQSSLTAIAIHPAYQRIIGMGPAALPLILRDLDHSGGQWFWALQSITGADPVLPEERGRVGAMRRAWLAWAEREGYSW